MLKHRQIEYLERVPQEHFCVAHFSARGQCYHYEEKCKRLLDKIFSIIVKDIRKVYAVN